MQIIRNKKLIIFFVLLILFLSYFFINNIKYSCKNVKHLKDPVGGLESVFGEKDNNIYVMHWGDEFTISKCKQIEGADYNTFKVVSLHFAKDKNNVYYFNDLKGGVIESADPETFKFVNFGYYKDKKYVYDSYGRIIPSDPDTYEEIGSWYAKDKSNVYFIFGPEKKIIKDADPGSFILLGSTTYAKDKSNVYYFGRKIEEADIDTFMDFSGNYAIDKNYVYDKGEIMHGKNPKEFYVTHFTGEIIRPQYKCYDSDHSKKGDAGYYRKGFVRTQNDNHDEIKEYEDYCYSEKFPQYLDKKDNLLESLCREDNEVLYEEYTCRNGCKNGKCNMEKF